MHSHLKSKKYATCPISDTKTDVLCLVKSFSFRMLLINPRLFLADFRRRLITLLRFFSDPRIGWPRLYYCEYSKLYFFSPRPSPEELHYFYVGSKVAPAAMNMEANAHLLCVNTSSSLSIWAAQILDFSFLKYGRKPLGLTIDFGCGTGWMSREMIRRGMKVACVDVNSGMVNFCADTMGTCGYVTDINNPKLIPFEFGVSVDVFEHLLDPVMVLRKIYEALMPGGAFVISVPNFNSKLFKISISAHPYYSFPAHLNYFTDDSLMFLMDKVGFKNISITTITSFWEKTYTVDPYIRRGFISSAPGFEFNDDWDLDGNGEHLIAYGFKATSDLPN